MAANQGSIGDVKHSVLPLIQFQELNGPGWVSLNGDPVKQDWAISTMIAFTNNRLPDARGLFIRTKDEGANNDPGGNRAIGHRQEDTFKRHRHHVHYYNAVLIASGGHGFSGGGFNSNSNAGGGNVNATEDDGSPDGADSETRPKNIVLYTYIKVN